MDTKKVGFVIGGHQYNVGPLTIWSLERCWEDIVAFADPNMDPLDRAHRIVNVVTCGLACDNPEIEADMVKFGDKLRRRLTFQEALQLNFPLAKLFEITGFVPAEDAKMGENEATSSTETSKNLSQNLSPTELKVEAGTELREIPHLSELKPYIDTGRSILD